jgi:hypothetical protein
MSGAGGRSSQDREDERTGITFDDDVWLDDDQTAPGVLG